MSNDSLHKVSCILKGILNPDNASRNLAVAELEIMRNNTPVLLKCLITKLHGILFILF